jgi:hypothetical protein
MKRKSEVFPPKKDRKQTKKNWHLKVCDGLEIKQSFADLWIKEKRFRRYRYNVETCDDGSTIYLTRPTRTSGVDFQVRVEGFQSRKSNSDRPSHADLVHDLRRKLEAKPRLKEDLFAAVSDIYDCVDPSEAIRRHRDVRRLTKGLPIDKVLRIIRWLFIEQDVTYWLGTGRNMFMLHLEQKVFGLKIPEYE